MATTGPTSVARPCLVCLRCRATPPRLPFQPLPVGGLSGGGAGEVDADLTRRAGRAAPLLIVAAVLVVTHGFWLHPRLTNQHVDLLSYWLPKYCYLGTSIRHGSIPT